MLGLAIPFVREGPAKGQTQEEYVIRPISVNGRQERWWTRPRRGQD